jgi:hypothetical protein
MAPRASFYNEWFLGLVKSFSVFKGRGLPLLSGTTIPEPILGAH